MLYNVQSNRYAGLLKYGDCGSCFVAKKRYWADKTVRIEYNCNGYHRYGKEHCTAHRIDEGTLDKLVYDELTLIKCQTDKNWHCIEADIKKWFSQESNIEKRILELEFRIKELDLEIEKILMERINDKENRRVYDTMLVKRREEKSECASKIEDIIADGGVSDTHLRMLAEEICISETKDGLHISIAFKARFATHFTTYDKMETLSWRSLNLL